MNSVDPKYLNHLLVDRLKVKRRPVALTYCDKSPPVGYEGANVVACAIIREAESGRLVYVDASHHDCWVGQYHLGWLPKPPPLITDGEYLTMAQGFFTPEGAKKNKAGTNSLPEGSIGALAAAPLDEVPDGVSIDVIVCVDRPYASHANRRSSVGTRRHISDRRSGSFRLCVDFRDTETD